jgi:hypothetical protein
LNSLTREESRANIVGTTVKDTRATRKKLLARIVTPRWEIKHHYHMYAIIIVFFPLPFGCRC